jgi:hypothetical protein
MHFSSQTRKPVKTVSSEIKEIEKTSEIQVVKAKFENKIHPHEKFKVRSWTQKFTSTEETVLTGFLVCVVVRIENSSILNFCSSFPLKDVCLFFEI